LTIIKDHLKITEGQIKSNPTFEAIINPSLFTRILTEYSTKLDEGSWNNYISLFELFTESKIIRDNEHWKATVILFKLRNYLVHGNEIEFYIQGNSKDNLKISTQNKNLNKILSYYREMDLLHLDK